MTSGIISVDPVRMLVKTLHQRCMQVCNSHILCVLDMKRFACIETPLSPTDLMVIQSGRECKDNEQLNYSSKAPYYIACRKSADKLVALTVTGTSNCTISVPANTRVEDIKRILRRDKITALSIGEQRLLCNGQVLGDYNFIGDHFLYDKTRYKSNKGIADSSSLLSVKIQKIVDIKKEVLVTLKLPNGSYIQDRLSLSAPIHFLREILWRQHKFPFAFDVKFFYPDGKELILLNERYNLSDYNIVGNVTLRMELVHSEFSLSSKPNRTDVMIKSGGAESTQHSPPVEENIRKSSKPKFYTADSTSQKPTSEMKSNSDMSDDVNLGLKKGFLFQKRSSTKKAEFGRMGLKKGFLGGYDKKSRKPPGGKR
jgi:hypothetical protein